MAVDGSETLPPPSVAVAVTACDPPRALLLVADQVPSPAATALAITVAPALTMTVLPASAVPLKVGVASLVRSSVSKDPVSLAASRSSVGGVRRRGVGRVGVVKSHEVAAERVAGEVGDRRGRG